MTAIIYYVAMSLDGYIATSNGGVDWLSQFEIAGQDYGYADFYGSVDALLMGRHTYEQVLEFGEWPYPGKPCWVLSRQAIAVQPPEVTLTSQSPSKMMATLQTHGVERVWLVGGGQLAASFRAAGLISEYILTVMPIILGAGIPLFATSGIQETLKRVECQPFPDGAVALRYIPAN